MAVINDNRPEESWDTGATYIIPSHQSLHLCGLLPANQHITLSKKREKKAHLVPVSKPQAPFHRIFYGPHR